MQLAANFEPEAAEVSQQIGHLLDNTVASFVVDHAQDRLHVGLNVNGLPNIGPFLTQQLVMEKRRHGMDRTMERYAMGQRRYVQLLYRRRRCGAFHAAAGRVTRAL